MDRRDFLKFMGMASSATVLSSCGVEKSTETILPYLVPPDVEDYIPGEPMYRNSVCTECPTGCGTTVKVVDFNPIKVEGMASHPLNDGALCMRGQASLMRLYHWDRYKTPMVKSGNGFEPISWEDAFALISSELVSARSGGRNNAFLSGMTSGTTSELISEFCQANGVERLPEFEVFSYASLRKAYQTLFDRNELPAYQIARSDFLLTIGADILETFGSVINQTGQVKAARDRGGFRWDHVEPHVSLTGYQADTRKVVTPGAEVALLSFLLNFFDSANLTRNSIPASAKASFSGMTAEIAAERTGLEIEYLNELAQSLAQAQAPLLITGGVSTAQTNGYAVSVLTGLLQYALGMTDNTVDFSQGTDYSAVGSLLDINVLAGRLNRDEIGVLFISDNDVTTTAPASMNLQEQLSRASFRVAMAGVKTETAEACDLILPLSHAYESWIDSNPRNGLTTFGEPTVEKLYDTRTVGEIVRGLSGSSEAANYDDWLKSHWQTRFGAEAGELAKQGFHESATARQAQIRLNSGAAGQALASAVQEAHSDGGVLYVVPSVRTYDGRSSVLPLAHEVPDPLSTVSYGTWLSVSQETAAEMGLKGIDNVSKDREELEIKLGGASQNLAHTVQPGLSKNSYLIHRDQLDASMLAYDYETGESLARYDNVQVSKTGGMIGLAVMAGSLEQGHRNIVRDDHPHEIPWLEGDETLYPPHDHPEYRWSISVDMESCTGCSACVAACHVENNIPCVGEEENLMGREMSWIRVQPYYHEDGTMDSLVMMCQQCDAAPCENVCPVYATYHNEEGLNVMVYNRCVGTRYCHNNCPYKVRRFNWFDWADEGSWAEPMNRMLNPDVWARPKGVMEKCTFCIQRIRTAKDTAKDEGRKVRDGEIVPACAQTCPTNAITFGNILDKNSNVYQKSQSNRAFRVLEILGTQPAVHYLRKEETA